MVGIFKVHWCPVSLFACSSLWSLCGPRASLPWPPACVGWNRLLMGTGPLRRGCLPWGLNGKTGPPCDFTAMRQEACRAGSVGSPFSLTILGVPGALSDPRLGPSWIAIETSLGRSPGGGLCQAQGTPGEKGSAVVSHERSPILQLVGLQRTRKISRCYVTRHCGRALRELRWVVREGM